MLAEGLDKSRLDSKVIRSPFVTPCLRSSSRYAVEAAEEKLVNSTEEAINLMRSVLENVRCALLAALYSIADDASIA